MRHTLNNSSNSFGACTQHAWIERILRRESGKVPVDTGSSVHQTLTRESHGLRFKAIDGAWLGLKLMHMCISDRVPHLNSDKQGDHFICAHGNYLPA